ncbi:hypothetical protein, partial [Sphingobium sp. Ant17]|uniref:hypothetical protein n=1 Tax=Sphingobium sp. Ant17 TaxID=1461752 RepID=UPI0005BA4D68
AKGTAPAAPEAASPETAPVKTIGAEKSAMAVVVATMAALCMLEVHHMSFTMLHDALRYILKSPDVKSCDISFLS